MMLAAAHYDNVEPFCISACVAKIIDIYDADTVTCAFELEGNIVRMSVRITGLDTPEIRPKRSNPLRLLESRAARRSRDAVVAMCTGIPVRGRQTRRSIRAILGASEKLVRLEPYGFDKYGRILGDIRLEDGISLRDRLLSEGWARIYGGGTRGPWTEQTLLAIADATDTPVADGAEIDSSSHSERSSTSITDPL